MLVEDDEDEDDAEGERELELLPPLLPNSELSRCCKASICSRIETASFNFSKDRSMGAYVSQ